jgi:Kef-type K+ transport system membrane component KefB
MMFGTILAEAATQLPDFGSQLGYVTLMVAAALLGASTAKLKRITIPSVLGQLLIGIAIKAIAEIAGLSFADAAVHSVLVYFLAELGVLFLLFETGLETQLHKVKEIWKQALIVAAVGITIPLVTGYLFLMFVRPDDSSAAHAFAAAASVATSVGVTAAVFKAMGVMNSRVAQIVLAAAAFDDIGGLLNLEAVKSLAETGTIDWGALGVLAFYALILILVAFFVAPKLAPKVSGLISKVTSDEEARVLTSLLFMFGFATIAHLAGMAPIVGALLIGLALDDVHFNLFDHGKVVHESLEHLVAHLRMAFVGIFFVRTGMEIEVSSLTDLKLWGVAILFSAIALGGKFAAGYFAFGTTRLEKKAIGISMMPRGEVGLIFASVGKASGVIGDEVFAIIIMMVVLTTLVAPVLIARIAKEIPIDNPAVEPTTA